MRPPASPCSLLQIPYIRQQVSDTDKFQFPLCALAFCEAERDRLERIISFGCVEAGMTMYRKLDEEIREQKAEQFSENQEHQAITKVTTGRMWRRWSAQKKLA